MSPAASPATTARASIRRCSRRSPPPTRATPRAYGDDRWTAAARRALPRALRPGCRGLPGLQRDGGERPLRAGRLPPLRGRDLPGDRAPQRRRVRRPRADRRGQAAADRRPPDGKLTPELLEDGIDWERVGDEHASQPRLVSISNSTELGTVYDADEVAAAGRVRARPRPPAPRRRGPDRQRGGGPGRLAARAHHRRRRRPRSPSAAPRTGCCSARRSSSCARASPSGFDFIRKQGMQLASKMRFLSAQLDAAPRRRPLAPQRLPRQRDGAPARRARSARSPGSSWPIPSRRTASSPSSRRRRSSSSSSTPAASATSTSGTRRRAWCG